MQRVLVVSSTKRPLMPCSSARARMLLKEGKAAVLRRHPFVIILKNRPCGDTQPLELKIDPGSKVTGIAVAADFIKRGKAVVFAAELQHRGHAVKSSLSSRRAIRRLRRNRNTRYRAPRFNNRTRPAGWLAPSLMSRVHNVRTWALRLQRFMPFSTVAIETARFDTQLMVNPEISGVEYQQGTLAGYELREYLLEKWERTCAYCGQSNLPLELEHIVPKTRGGSDRASNLTLACVPCNQRKGSLTASEFGFPDIQKHALMPLKDAAAVNATRYATGDALKTLGLPVSFWSGGRTKFNRSGQNYPKAHWIDAACVGGHGGAVDLDPFMPILNIKACGHGNRQMCRMDSFGFPRTSAKAARVVKGFRTGDLVRATVLSGKKAGTHYGRVAVRTSGSFNISTAAGVIQGISYRYCGVVHKADGYNYKQTCAPLGIEIPSIRAQEVS